MQHSSPSSHGARLPPAPIDRLVDPVVRFLHVESASGIVLLLATVAALALANSPLADGFLGFWQTPVGVSAGGFEFRHSLRHWINDGLMALFFFVVGLEVKRELVVGELRELRAAALPLAAALGGMVVPAALYLALQRGEAGERGWGIPMATDIAFVVGCLAVLGRRVPRGLRVMLLSLAIVDDIGAILVIAVGYTQDLNLAALGLGAVGIALVVILARLGVRSIGMYALVGIGVWFAFHESGVHATVAGVILGLLTPARPLVGQGLLTEFSREFGDFLHGEDREDLARRRIVLASTKRAAREAVSPLERLEDRLHPWVGFAIMPIFALANAGVPIQASGLRDPVAVAIVVGLCVGKPTGIVAFSWVAVRVGLARLPAGVTWGVITAGGVLSGIGFTMSLFIAGLALTGTLLDAAKIGVLLASTASAVAGMALLVWLLPKPTAAIQR